MKKYFIAFCLLLSACSTNVDPTQNYATSTLQAEVENCKIYEVKIYNHQLKYDYTTMYLSKCSDVTDSSVSYKNGKMPEITSMTKIEKQQ